MVQLSETAHLSEVRSRVRYDEIVATLDRVAEALGLSQPLYSETLARQTGTSVRTLQQATRAVAGLSLHRYLRAKRLLRARQELSTGRTSVKAAALANGFWHLGDFSRIYAQTYGEKPSVTLARAAAAGGGAICEPGRPGVASEPSLRS